MKFSLTMDTHDTNEIRFFDACEAAAKTLMELGRKALDDGDCRQFDDTSHEIIEAYDQEKVGTLTITETLT